MSRFFVGGLAYAAEEGDVEEFFLNAGYKTTEVKVIRDRDTQDSKGFAFVDFPSDVDTEELINNCTGLDLMGRTIRIDVARPRTDAPPERRNGKGERGRQQRD